MVLPRCASPLARTTCSYLFNGDCPAQGAHSPVCAPPRTEQRIPWQIAPDSGALISTMVLWENRLHAACFRLHVLFCLFCLSVLHLISVVQLISRATPPCARASSLLALIIRLRLSRYLWGSVIPSSFDLLTNSKSCTCRQTPLLLGRKRVYTRPPLFLATACAELTMGVPAPTTPSAPPSPPPLPPPPPPPDFN
jgi:hypothetical protein